MGACLQCWTKKKSEKSRLVGYSVHGSESESNQDRYVPLYRNMVYDGKTGEWNEVIDLER